MPLTREQICTALRQALEPVPWIHALWEGGSAAFGRVDEWSDLDLILDVEPELVEAAFELVEETLSRLSGGGQADSPAISLKYRLPEPTFHGHAQTFYQLRDAGPWLMLDLVVMKHKAGMRFSEVEQHGTPTIYFDKSGAVSVTQLDWNAHSRLLASRVEALAVSFPMFQPLVEKEFLRGDALNAFSFFQGLCLRPLVELLRIIHDPAKHSFHLRYARLYLPADVVARLERLCFVGSLEELERAHADAKSWFAELLPTARECTAALMAKHSQ